MNLESKIGTESTWLKAGWIRLKWLYCNINQSASKNKSGLISNFGDSDVGDFMMVTALRYWWHCGRIFMLATLFVILMYFECNKFVSNISNLSSTHFVSTSVTILHEFIFILKIVWYCESYYIICSQATLVDIFSLKLISYVTEKTGSMDFKTKWCIW